MHTLLKHRTGTVFSLELIIETFSNELKTLAQCAAPDGRVEGDTW